jgi:general nucleoside transport system ATP-binding protein
VLISEDLDEIFSLADRIAVVFKGSISRIFDRECIDRETIGLLMGGERGRVNECAAEIGLS